jgi:UDP-glucose 6-dehydrogenase
LEWEDVRGGILSDGRIAHAHTSVPGPDGKPGGGGTCIVKDSADLFHCCREAGVDAELIREMIERNERTRRSFDDALLKVELPR